MVAQVLRNPCPGATGIGAQVTPERVPKCGRNTHRSTCIRFARSLVRACCRTVRFAAAGARVSNAKTIVLERQGDAVRFHPASCSTWLLAFTSSLAQCTRA